MNSIQIHGLILNLIIYVIMLVPQIVISLQKSIYESKKNFLSTLAISTVIGIIFSCIIFLFPRQIFSIFTNTSGVINYSEYASNILFISSSLYSVKILIPAYFYRTNHFETKKITTLVLSKVVCSIVLMFIGYFLLSTKGFLFSFPICDLIFYIIYIKLFLNVIR